jgi:small-conductance mechanosensitive channel
MLKSIDPYDVWDSFIAWFGDYILTANTLYQTLIIVWAFIFGAVLYRFLRKPLTEAIDHSELPIRVKRTLNNLKRLIVPLATLIFLFLGTLVAASGFIAINVTVAQGLMKVLLAWIVIRVSLQFIANPVIRNFFALTIFTIAALSIFGILDETTTALDAIGFNIGKFRLSTLAVIKTVLSLCILLYLASFVSTFAERRVLRSKNLTRSSQVLVAKVIRITLIVFALLIGVNSAGIDLSIFAVFSGAVGLGVGFGLQKGVSNLFSGLLLLLDKSITPGDVIQLEESGTFGWVNHMGARYTEIITRDNKSYLIPNEDFITQRVVNWSHGNQLIRLQTKFGVHYKSDPHQVIALAKKAATAPKRVVETPEPVCWLVEFGDSSINFSLRFWIKDAENGVSNVTGEVLLALWDAFKEHGVEIPYPHREIFIHQKD